MNRPGLIIKVGGSLLDWPALPRRLAEDLDQRGGVAARPILVCGGGAAADAVRAWDRVHSLGEAVAHRLAVRSLDLTAHLLATIAPDLVVIERVEEAVAVWKTGRVPVLRPRTFLEELECAGPRPQCWDITSDTIAAWVADRFAAPDLVLLKSAPLPRGADLETAARLGRVDPAFPSAARRLPRVLYHNLRGPETGDIALWERVGT